ncbi:MAG: hydroxypyruvate isomerase family protein [Leadbetterella sp.]
MKNRREFLKKTVGFSALLSSQGFTSFANKPVNFEKNKFKLLYAPHFGMFKNNAGEDLIDQLNFMNEVGFGAIEDNGMMDRSVDIQKKVGETLAKHGMKMGVFVITFDAWPPKANLTSGTAEWRDTFLKKCKEAVEVAKRVNAKYMTVVCGNYNRVMPLGIQTANVIESLRRASDIFAPHNLTMVLEPLSDNPDLFLRYSDQTYSICKAVNSPSCKILFDMWHMQRNEGRLTVNMDTVWDEIAYFQIGDEPGRKEPYTGEINYNFLFKHIHDKAKEKNQEFILGMEHGNAFQGKEGELKLIEAYIKADNF